MTHADSTDDSAVVDALIVGGGVQGLTLFHELESRGYDAAIVTRTPLGKGQTLHAHGFLNSGYVQPDPALRRSVEEDWLGFLHERGVETYGEDRFFGIAPAALAEALSDAWSACGYPFEAVSSEALPAGFRGTLPEDEPTSVVRLREYCVPKRAAVRALSEGVTDRVVVGEVTDVQLRSGEQGGDVAVSAVTVEIAGTGQSVTVAPGVLLAATGTGTAPFVETLIDGGELPRASSAAIREQLSEVTVELIHMICIRGPADALPGVCVLLATKGLTVVSADVDDTHDDVDHDRRTWYVTPRNQTPEPVEGDLDSDLGEPDPAMVARGVTALLEAYPPLVESLDELSFGVYAGYKQNRGESRSERFCEPLEGFANVIVACPTTMGGAWLTAREATDVVEGWIEPGVGSGPAGVAPIPGAGEGGRVGDVVEETADFEWQSWEAFCEAYPGVEEGTPSA